MDIDKIEKIKRQIDDLRDELRAKECHISGLLAENTLLRDQLNIFDKDIAVYEKDQIRKGKVRDLLAEYKEKNEEFKKEIHELRVERNTLQYEIDDLKEDIKRRDQTIEEMAMSKVGLKEENEALKKKILYLNDDVKYWKDVLQDEINFSSKEIEKNKNKNEKIRELKQLVETKDKAFEAQTKFKYELLEDNKNKERIIKELQKEKVKQISFTGMLDMQKKINKLKRKNKKAGKMIANQKQQIIEERKENLALTSIIRSIKDELFGPRVIIYSPVNGRKEEKREIIEKIKDLNEKAYMNDATYRYMTDLETKNRELKIENMRLKEGKFPIR